MMRRLDERDADLAAIHIRIGNEGRGAIQEIYAALHEILEYSCAAIIRINLSSHFQAGVTRSDFALYVVYAATRMTDLQAKAVSTAVSGCDRWGPARSVWRVRPAKVLQ